MTAPPPEEPKRPVRSLAERLAAAKARVEVETVDLSQVPPSQYRIHDRLENWARWCHGRPGFDDGDASPMFRLHQSDRWEGRAYGAATTVPVDKFDAVRIAKGVASLPDKHRRCLHWMYVKTGRSPKSAAWALGLSVKGLAELVRDARQMLINRRV